MPLNKDEHPDREFWSRSISFTAADCETIFYLVDESQIDEQVKERLKNKVRGYYLSPKTEAMGQRILAANSKRRKKIWREFKKAIGDK